MLTVAGLQVPVYPFSDVPASVGAVAPVQIAGNAVNVGTVFAVIVCVKVVVNAHWPAFGVNVYVPVVVLLTVAGLHAPVIALVDVVDKVGAVDPVQIAGNAANVGVIVAGLIV